MNKRHIAIAASVLTVLVLGIMITNAFTNGNTFRLSSLSKSVHAAPPTYKVGDPAPISGLQVPPGDNFTGCTVAADNGNSVDLNCPSYPNCTAFGVQTPANRSCGAPNTQQNILKQGIGSGAPPNPSAPALTGSCYAMGGDIDSGNTTVAFRSVANNLFMTAANGGGGPVSASAGAIGSGESFGIGKSDGGAGHIHTGDFVKFNASRDKFNTPNLYVGPDGTAAATMSANLPDSHSNTAGSSWNINRVSGSSPLHFGDVVTLRAADGRYLTTDAAGGLYARSTSVGVAETFTIVSGVCKGALQR